ncbi:MAG: PEP-CTERM sorting domain-containing protein [Bryobacteraceae bacterium]
MNIMNVRLSMLFCLALASTVSASAGAIPFSDSGKSGTMAPGERWEYHAPFTSINEYSWGSPGAGQGSTQWVGSNPVTSFEISYDLPRGVDIDLGTYPDGSTFYSVDGKKNYEWIPKLINSDTIRFTDPSGDPALNNTESYFVNIFFTGKVTDSAFSGAWGSAPGTATPEPASLLLIAAGLLGIGGWVRLRRAAS